MKFLPAPTRSRRAAAAGLLLALGAGQPHAADTPIAEGPLFTSSAELIQPNIMFILDNSGSMGVSHLPDRGVASPGRYGPYAAQCNGLAYDPDHAYQLPVDHLGRELPMPTSLGNPVVETTAQRPLEATVLLKLAGSLATVTVGGVVDPLLYKSGELVTVFQDPLNYYVGQVQSWNSDTRELQISVVRLVGLAGTALVAPQVGKGQPSESPFYYRYLGSEPRLGYTYLSNGAVNTATRFYQECAAPLDSRPSLFVKVDVTALSPEARNYAIWSSYYRTRMALMKTAVSHAFRNLGDRYRVGYMTLNGWQDAQNFLDIRTFGLDPATGTGHKKDFYDRLFGARPDAGTPLRQALGRAGQYYARKMPGQTHDPIQYSCQRNYAILSTDGYWNDGQAPKGLDGVVIGDRDGDLERPMRDTHRTAGTLADVAAYYYETDLRDEQWGNCNNGTADVCENNVPGDSADAFHSGGDRNPRQHMTTFTLGLGANGVLQYRPDYLTNSSGDFADIVRGARNWPAPAANRPETTDDLWHAAVNGRGRYFSAEDPQTLARSLADALDSIRAASATASAASTSSLQPVTGDNDLFVAQFTTKDWTGDIHAWKVDPKTAKITGTRTWSAQEQLNTLDPAQRSIWFAARGANTLKAFTYENLRAEGHRQHFDGFCAKTLPDGLPPKQCPALGPVELEVANSGANLVRYLAGDRSFGRVFRERKGLLGDIINASPLYVGKPPFRYEENGYPAFAAAKAGRQGVLLAGANDGMLHAFDRATGRELWAFVPSMVLGKMYRLADTGYPDRHTMFVDGPLQMGDVHVDVGGLKQWRTIVVGGLGAGGRGYYALDVTDPAHPTLLWEFEHPDLGLSFGNPVITKRADGTWVVVFASGYNNTTTGDGNGHLFVLDAYRGGTLLTLSTLLPGGARAGSKAEPSGLAKINAWVPTHFENKALRFYGGDLKGHVWRFDIDGTVGASGAEAMLLATLKDGTGATAQPQPITTKPVLGNVSYNGQPYPVVYVGTGRYLGLPDVRDAQVQGIYALRDHLTASGLGEVRGRSDFVVHQIQAGMDAQGRKTRSGQARVPPVDWSTRSGWYMDFPVAGERVSVHPQLGLQKLIVGSNLPSPDACDVGGESFLYEIDFATGRFHAVLVGDVLVQGVTLVQLAPRGGGSAGDVGVIVTRSDGRLDTRLITNVVKGSLQRASWRELE